MKIFYDTTCPRCGFRMTTTGPEMANIVAGMHHCVDGVKTRSGPPVERVVPGPGERTKLPEEQGR